jgi:hypothetical protein
MKIFKKIADNRNNDSLATKLRLKRFESFFGSENKVLNVTLTT